MATTAIFAEILIVGLEAAAWLSLLIVTIFGTGWIGSDELEGWEALVTVLVLAAAYVLGIVIDRLADTAWGELAWIHRWRKGTRDEDGERPSVPVKRLTVMAQGGAMANFLEYQRSRLRVARATIVNLVVAIPIAAVYVGRNTDATGTQLTALILVGAGLLAVSIFAAARIQEAFEKRLGEAYEIAVRLMERGT